MNADLIIANPDIGKLTCMDRCSSAPIPDLDSRDGFYPSRNLSTHSRPMIAFTSVILPSLTHSSACR